MTQWKSVDEFDGNSIKASEMSIGETLEGKVEKINESTNYPGAFFLTLSTAAGVTRVFTSGDLSYRIKDGKIKEGYLIQIKRREDMPPKKKGSKARTSFAVNVDPDSKTPAV
jgi:hypothetical protein